MKVSTVKPGDVLVFGGRQIRIINVEVEAPLYGDPKRDNQYTITFFILGEGLFREAVGWSFYHFYNDAELDNYAESYTPDNNTEYEYERNV